jgi:dipeptidyl aminopeptidase/acylaminoacyl peptidase
MRLLLSRAVGVLATTLLSFVTSASHAGLPPLIPRDVLFGRPEKELPGLSPDGTRYSYIATSAEGALNVWVRAVSPAVSDTARQVTHETHDVFNYKWAPGGRHILYLKDADGDENNHLYSADLETGVVRDLTPFQGIRVENLLTDSHHPGEILVGINLRDRTVFDMYRVDLQTGAVTLDTQNPGDVVEWTVDRDFTIRIATALDRSDGSTIIRVRDKATDPWRDLIHWSFEEAGSDRNQKVLGFAPDGTSLYLQDPAGANTSRLVTMDARTGKLLSGLASHPRCDLWTLFDFSGGMSPVATVTDPMTGAIQAVGFEELLPEWKVLDPSISADMKHLVNVHRGVFIVLGQDTHNTRWLIGYFPDNGSNHYYIYDRSHKKAQLLFDSAPAYAKYTFAPMKPLTIRARDGLTIPCYLTLPVGVPAKNLPLVMHVHGGPWFRDSWGFNPEVQWLASRGYAVLNVNYRASTGFGRQFLNAGDHQFGTGAAQNDISDAALWAVKKGIADPKRIAIMGGSFGGYATLVGLAFTPELYACGVDEVGPSDLKVLIESFPSYWAPRRRRWLNRLGDVVHDDALNRRLSPVYHVGAIRAPLFIAHGVHDPRVTIQNSDLIVHALRERRLPVTYVVYTDEGHGFVRPENNEDFYGRVEEFLAQHLHGRAEPWTKVAGANVEVR